MADELLTPAEMAEADRLSIKAGPLDGMGLMRRAGGAVAALVVERYADAPSVDVLCGPGNNGGDGYVVARLLAEAGATVRVWALGHPKPGTDAAIAAKECPVEAKPLSGFAPVKGAVVIDALFGAGLSKAIDGEAAIAIEKCTDVSVPVVAVDLPSGVSGDSGKILGSAFRADLTVTFFRKKPGHLLYPGRELCGRTIVADIGIRSDALDKIKPTCWENTPDLWLGIFPHLPANTHKYARGHVGVFSGGLASTGAARLSARAAARAGAGAVTLLSPGNALQVNAAHLTSIILRKTDGIEDVKEWLDERKPAALVFGPAAGLQDSVGDFALSLIEAATNKVRHLVLDADALTHISRRRGEFLALFRQAGAPHVVLTPHEGEFARVFPELAHDEGLSKLDRARRAASLSGATVILKGPDTVIASPDGQTAINTNAPPWLATAGSGDVLAGITAGLLSQGMTAFEAACAAVWLHGAAGSLFGPGLIAEDLPDLLPQVLRDLLATHPAKEASR
ncbi:NAD(P)H-hydrate dehydratase [Mesorhizobium sp. VNQ89]|uniref:NAD(P)H-hydrate dehydratase n=1 Tax=Mesorhizobium quangtriensis TaxID=3157709 RepID=UPI0032B7BF49